VQVSREQTVRQISQERLEQSRNGVRIPVLIVLEEVNVTLDVKLVLQTLNDRGRPAQSVDPFFLLSMFRLEVLDAAKHDRRQVRL
jgi:hypothetical protein